MGFGVWGFWGFGALGLWGFGDLGRRFEVWRDFAGLVGCFVLRRSEVKCSRLVVFCGRLVTCGDRADVR